MEIYFEIIKKHLKKENIHSLNFNLISLFFEIFFKKKYSIKEKYIFLGKVYNNIFLSNECKNHFFSVFSIIQKTYFSLLLFKKIFLFKKAKLIVENDLSLNLIFEKDKFVMVIHQKLNKYLFHIRDLLKIITSSIGRSDFFFSTPISIKNPYNNYIFSKSNLYNIYFFVKFKTNFFSELFHQYFLCDFNLSIFFNKNTYLLRKHSIQDYYKNGLDENWEVDIEEMLEDFNFENPDFKIIIDINFPNKKLIKIMKPYLNLYLIGKYSNSFNEKQNANKQLKRKLKEFFVFNPNFGRKMVVVINKPLKQNDFLENKPINPNFDYNTINKFKEVEIVYNEDHKLFFEKKIQEDFLNSHSYLKSE